MTGHKNERLSVVSAAKCAVRKIAVVAKSDITLRIEAALSCYSSFEIVATRQVRRFRYTRGQSNQNLLVSGFERASGNIHPLDWFS